MSEKLLPCPFCNNAEAECNECEVGKSATAYFVACNEAKCGVVSGYFPTSAMARAAWNRRPSPQPAAQAVTEEQIAIADQIIGAIEERFPNWKSYRDLIDCIDCTLHDLRSGPAVYSGRGRNCKSY